MSTVFDSISSNIDEVLSIIPSANVFALETLTFIIRAGLSALVELIDLVKTVISNNLTQMVNFPCQVSDCDSHSPALLDLFFFSDASICSAMAFLPLGNSDHGVVTVSLTFYHILNRMPHFSALLMTVLVLIETAFEIIWEMFHGRISLNLVLLLVLVNFVSGFRLESMYICLIESIRSSLTHLHGFQQLLLLP